MNDSDEATSAGLRDTLIDLHQRRENAKEANKRQGRSRLSTKEREAVLQKTGGKCHICGGEIAGPWDADHIMAHSTGGQHATDNYLPAHESCNNYRWDYLPEEFELILKLGVWARTQVEKGTRLGRDVEESFAAYEAARASRRKGPD